MGLFGKKKDSKKEETVVCSCNGGSIAKDEGQTKVTDGAGVSIKVLGSGCKNCQALLENTKEAVSALHLPADIEYVTDMQRVAGYGVMSTPALVVNEQVVSMGRVLKPADVQKLLKKIGIA
ncbi:MAG: thioredoxin family protein [Bilifractor sp.]|jgi:small redox-active disulfide protein 2